MKNRKSLLGLGLLVLVLILGVGYAVVNDVELTISGTASANSKLNVYFTGTPQTTNAENGKVTATITNENTATIEVTDLTYEETVTAVYTIKSDEKDITANLSEKSISVMSIPGEGEQAKDLTEFFDVKLALAEEELAPGASTTATVTVQLVKTPTEFVDSTADIEIVILAEAAAQN